MSEIDPPEPVIFIGGPAHDLRGMVAKGKGNFDFYRQVYDDEGEPDGFRVSRYLKTGLHVPITDEEGNVTQTRRMFGYLLPSLSPAKKPQDFFDDNPAYQIEDRRGTDTQTD